MACTFHCVIPRFEASVSKLYCFGQPKIQGINKGLVWYRNAQGKIELIAAQPTHVQPSLTCTAMPN
jgi:hypothetical protein